MFNSRVVKKKGSYFIRKWKKENKQAKCIFVKKKKKRKDIFNKRKKERKKKWHILDKRKKYFYHWKGEGEK